MQIEQLVEYANKITDEKLRSMTLEMLLDPKLSNKNLIYGVSELKKIPSWVGAHHNYEGGLLDHTVAVTEACIKMADIFEKIYRIKINYDHLISGALLHDISKVFMISKDKSSWKVNGCLIDHGQFSLAELYARGFPEGVLHIVGAHGGELGQRAAYPKTMEALILFYCDVFDATFESHISKRKHVYRTDHGFKISELASIFLNRF